MNDNKPFNLIENSSQSKGSQFLGFLTPGGQAIVASPAPMGAGAASPRVMAIPVAELFVRHDSPNKRSPAPDARR